MHVFISIFNIQAPLYLALLLLLPLLWYVFQLYTSFRKKGVLVFGSMVSDDNPNQVGRNFWLFLIGMAFLAIAALNPRIQGQPVKIDKKGGDVIFAIDVSKSMLAQDIKPNRLERAKLVCLDLLKGFDNQRVAVVVFAEGAYVTMPFTTNYSSVSTFVMEASPNLISAQGSSLANLIATLLEFFGKDEVAERGVVVLSDGEDHSELTSKVVSKANHQGLIFFPVGMGTAHGGPIPQGRGYYLEDKSGKKVITKLNAHSLKKMTGKNGQYFSVAETHALLREIRQLRDSNFSDITTFEYRSLFQYFLFPGLVFIILSFVDKKISLKK